MIVTVTAEAPLGTVTVAGTVASKVSLLARLDRGDPVHLAVPNPDLIYPAGIGAFGFAAGTLAAMFEGAATRSPYDVVGWAFSDRTGSGDASAGATSRTGLGARRW